jgi:hypothetical protein
MKTSFSYIITPGTGITAVINGETHTITSDNASYGEVLGAIKAGEDPLYIADLFRTANAVKRYSKGAFEVSADGATLLFRGEEIRNVVVDRIFLFMREGLPVDPLLRFLEKLLNNPSKLAIEALYTFLENGKMPITEDGCFLGYKGVTAELLDCHTRTVDNSVGATPSMPRRNVNDDPREICSDGFHVGTLDYATKFGERTVIVKVNPADVVSVPSSNLSWKLRTCKYEVIAEFNGPLNDSFANSASPYEAAGFVGLRTSNGVNIRL